MSTQGDHGPNGDLEKSWSPEDEYDEVDGGLRDDQAAHDLCKDCTERIDSAEPKRGNSLWLWWKKVRYLDKSWF